MDSLCQSSPPETAAGPGDVERSIPDCFEQLAAEFPLRPALGAGGWPATFAELNRAANALAHAALARGAATGERAAILMRHDGPLIAAALGALKTGSAVVVLNPADPPARLEQIVNDVAPRLIVTDGPNRELAGRFAGTARPVVVFEEQLSGNETNPAARSAPDDLAFLIFTSGSTGRPKGVMQSHRNVLHNVRRLSRGMALGSDDRVTLLASLSGGQGLSTTWCALLNGATLCPFPLMEKGVTGLKHWLIEQQIGVFIATASVFRHFMKTLDDADGFPAVRLVRLASEPATALDFAAFQKHFADHAILFNTLSSSETGNITQCRLGRNERIADGRLPIGQPAEGMEVHLLDERGREVSAGEPGEIVVRSRYLSPGYWRDAALTAERFSGADGPDGARLFRSGDLGRRAPDGTLFFVGRKDDRVKVRGNRIELSEIEDALNRQPGVDRAVVCARTSADEDAQLVAYVVPRAGAPLSTDELRLALRAALPASMVPSGFVFLEQFPFTPQGKIDREKLRQIDPPASATSPSEPPATATEKLLAGLWRETLEVAAIGRRDDFFDLGGDSLKAAVVAARLHAALGIELDLRAFADHPVLADLAAAIDRLPAKASAGASAGGHATQIVPVPRDVPLPLSFAQERIWKYSRTPEASLSYTVTGNHRIRGPLDAGRLRECMNALARRHEILRTTFREINGRPAQIVQPAGPVELPLLDFTGPDAETRATEFFREQARRSFDLERGPLLRFWLARVRENEHWLLRAGHHLIVDAWSWTVYFRELGLLYEAKQRGEISPLPEIATLQYGDYAVWQRTALAPESAAYRAAVDWWADTLAGEPRQPAFPFQRLIRRRRADPADGLIWWGLDPATSLALDRVARETGATYYMVRLAAFAAFLSAGTRRPDFVLGTYVTNRTRIESQNLFGCFANLATLRVRGDAARTFREWIADARTMTAETQARGEIPYEQLREDLRRRGVNAPEIRAIFSTSDNTAPVRFGGLEVVWQDRRIESMPWGFNLVFNPHHEADKCRVSFDARLYDPAKVRAWLKRFARFLDAASHQPEEPVAKLLAAS